VYRVVGPVWGEAHPLDYIIVIPLLESIEQLIYPNQHVLDKFCKT
jgi:hypothetical protein